jgi:cytochrome c oxidase subunit IV
MNAAESSHSNYLLVGLALIVLTIFEVMVVSVTSLPALPFLLLFGAAKALLIMMYFMHLRFDRRLYALLFGIGIIGGLAMIWVVSTLVQVHP